MKVGINWRLLKKYLLIVDNSYQHDSGVLLIFIPNKSIGQLLEISPTEFPF